MCVCCGPLRRFRLARVCSHSGRLPRRWLIQLLMLTTATFVIFRILLAQTFSTAGEAFSRYGSDDDQLIHHRRLARMLYVDSSLNNQVCSKLASGTITNTSQLDSMHRVSRLFPPLPINDSHSSAASDFCRLLRQNYGFGRWPVTAQEEQFPLAFSFKLHKDPVMFQRLLSVLWRPHNLYCLHVDNKAPPDVFEHISKVASCFPNVKLADTRLNVVYASISSLNADIECAKLALKSSIQWRYHINLCGQDFPLRTNLEMVQILEVLNGTNDVENSPPSEFFRKLSFAFKSLIKHGINLPSKIPKEPFPFQSFEVRKGSAYNILNRSLLEWALQDKVNLELLSWLNDTWAPDELFWATLSNRAAAPGGPGLPIRHSDNTVLSKAVVWLWDKYRCRGVSVRNICIFSSFDLPWLLSRHELIANKFDPKRDSIVLDCLEAELEWRTLSGFEEWQKGKGQRSPGGWPLVSSLNWTFYRSLPQFARSD